MTFIRWFRVENWAGAFAQLVGAARKEPCRKPPRRALGPEPLEDRTLLSAGPSQAALLVVLGEAGAAPAAQKGQPAEAGAGVAPAQPTSQGDVGARGQPDAGAYQQGGPVASGSGHRPAPAAVTGGADQPAPAQTTSQGDEGDGGRPRAGADQRGDPAAIGPEADGGNGRQAQLLDAFRGNEEAVGRLRGVGQDAGQQGAPGAAFSGDKAVAGREDRPGEAFGGGAAARANVTIEATLSVSAAPTRTPEAVAPPPEVEPFAPAVLTGAPEAFAVPSDALFAAAAAASLEAGPDGGPGNASSTDRAGALVGSDLAALGSLPAGALYQLPLLPAGSLNGALSLGGGNNPSDVSRFLDGDGAFLELWDKDQLLFPDSLPKVDEMQLPGGLPWGREMPLPERTPNLGGPLSPGERPAEAPLQAAAVGEAAGSAPARPDGKEAVAEVALAATPGGGLALSPPDADRPKASPADPAGAPADRVDAGRGQDSLRPYKIAVVMFPFLLLFGFTAVTLRERVLDSLRRWQKPPSRRRRRR
jgi:hypothetical protein